MPELKNETLRKEFASIAKVLNERGENLSGEHVASAIVRAVLIHMGATELMTDEYKEDRADIIKAITPCITAAKNLQNSYLSKTEVLVESAKKDADGKPIMVKEKMMPEVKGGDKASSGEFA